MNIKERADEAIKRIDSMTREEFEKVLHKSGYYPRRLDESVNEYLTRIQVYRTRGKEPCMFDGLDPNKAYSIACPCPRCSMR